MVCTKCEMCGKPGTADLLCTNILEEGKVEKACWCVCKKCHKDFEEKIAQVYKELAS